MKKILMVLISLVVLLLRQVTKTSKKMNLEQLKQMYSDRCDQLIIKTLREDSGLRYISGYFIVKPNKEKSKLIVLNELFFQNSNYEWIKTSKEDIFDVNRFYGEEIDEILNLGEQKFLIDNVRKEKEE